MAKALQAKRIVAISSAKNADFVLKHGATEVVDYTNTDTLQRFWEMNQNNFHCIYDTVTGNHDKIDYVTKSIPVMNKSNGKYIQLGGNPSTWVKKFMHLLPSNRFLPLVGLTMNKIDLENVSALLGKINARPIVIPQQFNEKGLRKGFDILISRRTRGKIVYDVSQSNRKEPSR